MSSYVYDQAWKEERERLAGIEAQWDLGTKRHIEALGIGAGARCWEIGGGGGSIAEWLGELVGSSGHVLATDLDPRFLEPLAGDHIEVVPHDVLEDPLPDDSFDLIHARLVLEHIPRSAEVLDRLVSVLAPGGWLLIEDYDWDAIATEPPSELFERVTPAVLGFMTEVAGFDPIYGRRLRRALAARALDEVGAEGRSAVLVAGDPGVAFYSLSLQELRGALVERGSLTDADCDRALTELADPDRTLLSPLMIAAWGRARGDRSAG